MNTRRSIWRGMLRLAILLCLTVAAVALTIAALAHHWDKRLGPGYPSVHGGLGELVRVRAGRL